MAKGRSPTLIWMLLLQNVGEPEVVNDTVAVLP